MIAPHMSREDWKAFKTMQAQTALMGIELSACPLAFVLRQTAAKSGTAVISQWVLGDLDTVSEQLASIACEATHDD